MRYAPILFALAPMIVFCGCSGVSKLERVNLTTIESRQEYIKLHPGGVHNDCIRNGEIMSGMEAHEVAASWGLPNVYVVTRTQPKEQWIYYVKDPHSLSMLIYTLAFANDTLQVWDIDQKRFVGQEIVAKDEIMPEITPSTSLGIRRK